MNGNTRKKVNDDYGAPKYGSDKWYMSDDEIKRSWRCCAKKSDQIKVLGQLNCKTKKQVIDKLTELGIETGENVKRHKKFTTEEDRRIWRLRHDENRTFKSIAVIIGHTTGETVRNRYGELLEEHKSARIIIETALRAYIKAGKCTDAESKLIDELIRRGI